MMKYELKARGNSETRVKTGLGSWIAALTTALVQALPCYDMKENHNWKYCKEAISSLQKELDFNFLLETKHVTEEDLAALSLIRNLECTMNKFEEGSISKYEFEKFVVEDMLGEKKEDGVIDLREAKRYDDDDELY